MQHAVVSYITHIARTLRPAFIEQLWQRHLVAAFLISSKQKEQSIINHFSDGFNHLAPSSAWTKSDLTHVLLSAAYTLNWWPREYNQKFFLLKVKVGPVDRSQISLVFGLHCQCLIRAHGRKYSRINVSKFLLASYCSKRPVVE